MVRGLRAKVEYKIDTRDLRALAVSSAVAGRGEDDNRDQLAVNMASTGRKKVLLMDLDLRKSDRRQGDAHRRCSRAERISVGVRFQGEDHPESRRCRDYRSSRAGNRSQSPVDMLAGEKFRSFLKELRGHFDLLILDTPPILPVPDAVTISEQVDAFILLFRLSFTPHKLLRQAIDELGTGKIVGVVLNGDEKKSDKYYSRILRKVLQIRAHRGKTTLIITLENRFFSLRSAVCFIVEGGIIMLSVVASFLLLYGRAGTPVVSMGDVVARALVITFFCQSCMYLLDLYNFKLSQTWGEMLFALAIAIGFVCIGIGLLSYAIPKFGVAGKMYYLSILIASVFLLLWRLAFELYITRFASQENILIVGTGEVARQVGEEVRRRKRLGFHLVGFINTPPAKSNPSTGEVGEVLGDPAQMDRIIEQHDVDKIVVAITERRGEYPVKEMLALRVSGCQVVEWPGFFEKLSGRIPIDSLAPSFFIFNEGFRKSRFLLIDPPGRQRDRRRRLPGSPPAGLSRRRDPHQARFPRSRHLFPDPGGAERTNRSGSTNSARCGTTRSRTGMRSGRWRTTPGSQGSATSSGKRGSTNFRNCSTS